MTGNPRHLFPHMTSDRLKRLLSFVSRRARRPEVAEDLLGEALVRVTRREASETIGYSDAMIVRTALNIAIDAFRRDRRVTSRLDVCTRLSVQMSAHARTAHLLAGRANITVAPDAARPMQLRVAQCLIASPRATLDLTLLQGGAPSVTVVRGDARVVEARGLSQGRQLVLSSGQRLSGALARTAAAALGLARCFGLSSLPPRKLKKIIAT